MAPSSPRQRSAPGITLMVVGGRTDSDLPEKSDKYIKRTENYLDLERWEKRKLRSLADFSRKTQKSWRRTKENQDSFFPGFSRVNRKERSARKGSIFTKKPSWGINHIRPRSDDTYEIKAGIPKICIKKPRKLSPIAASWAIPSPRSAMLPFSLMYWLRRVQVTAKLVLPCFRPASAMSPRSTVEAIIDPRSPFCTGNRHGFADHLLRLFHPHDPTQLGTPAILPSSAFVYSVTLEHVILAQRREIIIKMIFT